MLINNLSRKAGEKMKNSMSYEEAVVCYMKNQRGSYEPSRKNSAKFGLAGTQYWVLRDELGMLATVFADGKVS